MTQLSSVRCREASFPVSPKRRNVSRRARVGSSEPEIRAIRHLFGPGCVGESSFVRARIPGHSVKGRKTPVVAHSDGRALLNSIDVTVPNGLHDRDWSRFYAGGEVNLNSRYSRDSAVRRMRSRAHRPCQQPVGAVPLQISFRTCSPSIMTESCYPQGH